VTNKNAPRLLLNINKITLAFPDKNEALFRKKYFSDSIIPFRIAFLLVTILYAGFGYLDSLIVPEYADRFFMIRYYIVVPFLSFVFLLSFTKIFQKIWQSLLLISFIISGVGIIIMTMLVPDNYAYYAGMMLVYSAGYFFIKLRFFYATIAGWTTLVVFNVGAIFYVHTSTLELINHNFFFISANMIGMFAAYSIEYYSRHNFFINQKLDDQKTLVENLNINLEKKVEERTQELLAAKERAEESDLLKSAFLANMSHEIRTPMNGILGFAELLKKPNLSGEDQQRFIGIIQKSGDRMLNIINDIVSISKIESGLMEVNMQVSNINEQMEFIYNFFKPEVELKGVQFSLVNSLNSNKTNIKTDREKVYAILTNLVKNAIKFTQDGSIEFGYLVKNNYLEFYVKDTGIGIPKNRQKAIFERFIQADIEDKNAFQGAGLGLSISVAYVKLLGGEIWVESEVDKGTCFYFTLPFVDEVFNKNQSSMEVLIANEVFATNKLKVLIVEDDVASEQLLSIHLKEFSNDVTSVVNGVEAVANCRENSDIDLILMDVLMPEMDGLEATRQIRKFNKDVIIITQSAFGLEGDREKAIAAGCNDYITKPIKAAELKELIINNLNRKCN
jgi:signal transduction histidine kinase/CheY-like chemotaxis protein